jgi:membrane-associated phospholipid phosphatase
MVHGIVSLPPFLNSKGDVVSLIIFRHVFLHLFQSKAFADGISKHKIIFTIIIIIRGRKSILCYRNFMLLVTVCMCVCVYIYILTFVVFLERLIPDCQEPLTIFISAPLFHDSFTFPSPHSALLASCRCHSTSTEVTCITVRTVSPHTKAARCF